MYVQTVKNEKKKQSTNMSWSFEKICRNTAKSSKLALKLSTFCFPLLTHLVFVSFSLLFFTEFQLELYNIFNSCNQLTRSQARTEHSYPFTFWLALIFSSASSYISSFHHVVPSNIKPCNGFKFSHRLSPPATTTTHFVHSSLV